MSLVVDEHRQYIEDNVRLAAFGRAIAASVRPGDVVLDLASGTGILGLLACRHGASRVYAIESGPIVGVARSLARANGFGDRIVHVHGLSTRIDLPEPVDAILTDQIGRLGFEAGLLEYLGDARDRFLKPGGRLVPGRLEVRFAPVECPEQRHWAEFWSVRRAGFDFTPIAGLALNTGYPFAVRADQLLAAPAALISIDLGAAPAGASFTGQLEIAIERRGTMHGLAGGFAAALTPQVTMTNLPSPEGRINRRNAYLPIASPVDVREGDRVRVSVRVMPAEGVLRWVVETPDGRRFAHSTIEGMLLAPDDLAKTRPEYVPTLTEWGRARLSVLELCDGVRSLAEVERAVAGRHPAIFPSRAAVGAFVNEVVGPYTAASA